MQDTIDPDRLVVGVSSRSARSTTREGGSGESRTREGDSGESTTGDEGEDAAEVLRQVYHPAVAKGTPFIVTDLATSELVKVSANAFLATKISIHQRYGRDRRSNRSRRHTARRRDRARRAHRATTLGAGIGFGGGPAEETSAPSTCTRKKNSVAANPSRSCAKSTPSTCVAANVH